MFESSVNSDGSQTINDVFEVHQQFESSVNSDGSQTVYRAYLTVSRLRVV